MRFALRVVVGLLIAVGWGAGASLDFAVSTNLLSLYNRWGVDAQGNILIAANPESCALPTVNPLFTCGPIWIGKLDASGQRLVFATYLGTSTTILYTAVAGIAADGDGNVIVAAHTVAPDLPTANAIQPAPKSNLTSWYVAKLSPDGTRLIYATYLGGSGGNTANSLAVDGAGAAYVAGSTTSADFPTTDASAHEPALFPALVAKLSAAGELQYAVTFPFELETKPVQLDSAGSAVLVSGTQMMTVAPDGGSLARTRLPVWAVPPSTCSMVSGVVVCAAKPWVFPRASGGYRFAGAAGSGVPVPGDALQQFQGANGYLRIENGKPTETQLTAAVSNFAVDPADRNRVYAATGAGLYLSTDNGSTWNLLREGAALAVAIDPVDSNRVYLSVDAAPQMYRSTDGGSTWTAISNGLPPTARIGSLAADANVPGLLYGAGGQVFRSRDGGDTWDVRAVGPSVPNMSPSATTFTNAVSIQADPVHAGWAYVVGKTACLGFCPVTQNLSRTQDGGDTWTSPMAAPDPLISTFVTGLVAVDPNSADVVETVPGVGGTPNQAVIYRGGDLNSPSVLYPVETTSVAFDPGHAGTIYLAVHIAQGSGAGYFVVKSEDSGATWNKVVQLDRPTYALTVGVDGVIHASQTPNLPEGYVVATDAAGQVQYGTYFGGAFTQVNAAAVSGGTLFAAGKTQGGLPLANPFQCAVAGGADGFVSAFDDSGKLLWSTYLGGSADDSIDWVLPLPDGSAVVIGTTYSDNFPQLQPSALGGGSTFIAHLRP